VLGQQAPDDSKQDGSEHELDLEMQHILAGAITKILNQKSIRDSVANLHSLILEELEEQLREGDVRSSQDQRAGDKSLKMQASQKLLETLQNGEDSHSQKSILSKGLSRTFSK